MAASSFAARASQQHAELEGQLSGWRQAAEGVEPNLT
jgi:hypothetical protein